MANDFKNIACLFNAGQNNTSKFFSYFGLGIGVFLLLTSLQVYIDINRLLKNNNPRKNGYDFISVTKTITNENMGMDNRFSEAEIADLKKQSFISDAAPLSGNQFRVTASAGKIIPFSTDLFLESVRNDFLDTVPPGFSWRPGQTDVPIIFSADFLEMYNVFAPGQDLPQLSESSIAKVTVNLECYGPSLTQNFSGHIVALSDRINSVLVPESFLQWANKNFGNNLNPAAARVYLKTTDANNISLLNYLQQKNYHVNKDKTKFGRVKQVLQLVVTGLTVFAIIVILLAVMLFSFYLRLMIAESKHNLQLLISLGYSPKWISREVSKKWVVAYTFVIFSGLALTAIMQWLFQHFSLNGREELSAFLHVSVMLLAIVLLVVCTMINYRLIKKLLYRL